MNLFEPIHTPDPAPTGEVHALLPGAMLEDFEITRVLASTETGVIYQATHALDGNTVAIKEYLPAAIALRNAEGQVELRDPAHEEAFHRGLQSFVGEALTLSQFDRPHLLRVSCVWEANGTAYRAMPLLLGSTLQAMRSATPEPASQAQLQALLDGLLDALQTLQAAGLAHGRIEPRNIFMVDRQQPVLMDFDAVRHAVLSEPQASHIDAYADPSQTPQMFGTDLHAVAAVLHYAVSGDWPANDTASQRHHEPLVDVLTRLKDHTSALGYPPEFLTAIDAALTLSPVDRPRSVPEFRALFEGGPAPTPTEKAPVESAGASSPTAPSAPASEPAAFAMHAELAATPDAETKPLKRPKKLPPERPQSDYPLNSSESVLALLAGFDRRSSEAMEDIEPFESPPVPTLTEEAEPSLPPMRTSLFDAMDAGDPLPQDGVGYGRTYTYQPMPPVPKSRWRRTLIWGFVMLVFVVGLGALGWHLFD